MTCTKNRSDFFTSWEQRLQQAYDNYACLGEGCITPRICDEGGCYVNPNLINTDTMSADYGQGIFDSKGWMNCLYAKFIDGNFKSRADIEKFVTANMNKSDTLALIGSGLGNSGWNEFINRVSSKHYPANRWLFLEIHKRDRNHAFYEGWIPFLNSIAANDELPIDDRIEAATYAEATVKAIQEESDFDKAIGPALTAFGAFTGLTFFTSAALKKVKIDQAKDFQQLAEIAQSVAPVSSDTPEFAPLNDVPAPVTENVEIANVEKNKKKEANKDLGLAGVAGIAAYLFAK